MIDAAPGTVPEAVQSMIGVIAAKTNLLSRGVFRVPSSASEIRREAVHPRLD
jgi:hypothetical protein